MDRNQNDLSPLVVSIGGVAGIAPPEDGKVRHELDAKLRQFGKFECAVSALMVFPYKQWLRRKASMTRGEFFNWYLTSFLPRLLARNRLNSRGTYFERMICFRGTNGPRGKQQNAVKNQLEQIIQDWERAAAKGRRPRRSALQVGCFDPPKDHNGSALSPFPCLQQVSFSYDHAGQLGVNAYYPTQYVFDRAYGNYLGLIHLGYFMANELHLQFARLNCFIGQPELGRHVPKGQLRDLVEKVRQSLPSEKAAALA